MPLVYRALSEQQVVDLARLITANQHKLNLPVEVDIQRLRTTNLSAIAAAEEEKRILQALDQLIENRQQKQIVVLDEPAKTYFTDKQISSIWKTTPPSKRNARDLPIPNQYFRQKTLKERAPAILIRVLSAVGYLGTPRLICDDDEGNNRRLTITARRKPLSHLAKGDAPYRMVWGFLSLNSVDVQTQIWHSFATTKPTTRAFSSAGRALPWHGRGQRFDPVKVHQTKHTLNGVCFVLNKHDEGCVIKPIFI